MSTAELIEQLRHLENADRLAVIEAATRLVRDELQATSAGLNARIRGQVLAARDLYQEGGELAEWAPLDAEDFGDDSLSR